MVKASAWGLVGLLSFAAVHLACDFGWNTLISVTSHKTGSLWSEKVHRWIFGGCGALLVVFGGLFVFDALPF